MGCFRFCIGGKLFRVRLGGAASVLEKGQPRDSSSGCTIEGFLADTWKIKE